MRPAPTAAQPRNRRAWTQARVAATRDHHVRLPRVRVRVPRAPHRTRTLQPADEPRVGTRAPGAGRAPAGGRRGRIRPARPTRTARRGAGRAWVPARRSVGRGRQSGPKVETDQNGVGACRAAWLGGHGARGRVGGARPARCPQERRMGAAKVWLIVHVNLVHVNFVLRLLSGHPPADTTHWSWPGSSG